MPGSNSLRQQSRQGTPTTPADGHHAVAPHVPCPNPPPSNNSSDTVLLMNILRLLLVVAFIGLTSASSFAWNETGHRAIAFLAFEHLTPEANAKVAALLE